MSNKIKFERLDDYFHAYYVEGLHDRLVKYKDSLVKEFMDNYKEFFKERKVNVTCEIKEFNDEFMPLMYYIVENYYEADEAWKHTTFGTYLQDNKRQINQFHTHWSQTTLSSVMYIDPLEKDEGGELELWFPPAPAWKFQPEKDYIYFFPSWVLHRPVEQKVDKKRICMNWGYQCNKRPIHKISADRW